MTKTIVTSITLLILSSGCREPDSILLAKLDCDPTASPSYSIQVMLSEPGLREDTKIFPSSPSEQPLQFPTSLVMVIPRSHSGQLDLAFLALDAGSGTTAHATTRVTLEEGAQTTISVRLSAGNNLCGNKIVDPGEGCDDGNLFSFDGCDNNCQLEATGSTMEPDAGSPSHPDAVDTIHPDTQQPDALPNHPQDAIPGPDMVNLPPDTAPLIPDIQPSPAPLGASCSSNSQCASGFCDLSSTKTTCSAKLPLGAACTSIGLSSQCESTRCEYYKCAPAGT